MGAALPSSGVMDSTVQYSTVQYSTVQYRCVGAALPSSGVMEGPSLGSAEPESAVCVSAAGTLAV